MPYVCYLKKNRHNDLPFLYHCNRVCKKYATNREFYTSSITYSKPLTLYTGIKLTLPANLPFFENINKTQNNNR